MEIINQTAEQVNEEFVAAVLPVSVFTVIFAVVGMFGNIFVLYVHVFKYQQCNFRYFVLGLCAIDLLSSVTILPMEVFTHLNWYVFPSAWLCKLKAFLNVFLSACSVYVLLLIAIDRYLKVCAPHRKQMTSKTVLKCYGCCFIIVCFQSWTILFVWGKHNHLYSSEMVEVSVCGSDPNYNARHWRIVFSISMLPLYIAMTAMIVIYIFVGKKISGVVMTMKRQSKRKRKIRETLNLEDPEQKNNRANKKTASVSDIQRDSNGINRSSASSSLIDDKMREEIKAALDKDSEEEMVVYKVEENNIVLRRESSAKRSDRKERSYLSFSQKRKLEERSSRIINHKSENVSPQDSNVLSCSSIEGQILQRFQGPPSDASDDENINVSNHDVEEKRSFCSEKEVPEKVDETQKNGRERKTVSFLTDTLRRRKNLIPKAVKFNVSAREKLKRRTFITFVFTAIFIGTMLANVVLFSRFVTISGADAIESPGSLAVSLFFFKLFFINCVIHPILYGILDPRFRKTLRQTSIKVVGSVMRSYNVPEEEA